MNTFQSMEILMLDFFPQERKTIIGYLPIIVRNRLQVSFWTQLVLTKKIRLYPKLFSADLLRIKIMCHSCTHSIALDRYGEVRSRFPLNQPTGMSYGMVKRKASEENIEAKWFYMNSEFQLPCIGCPQWAQPFLWLIYLTLTTILLVGTPAL